MSTVINCASEAARRSESKALGYPGNYERGSAGAVERDFQMFLEPELSWLIY